MSKSLFTSDMLVRSANGTVDVDASKEAFAAALDVYMAEVETETAAIADAVAQVFDKYRGARVNMPYLVNAAAQLLNVQPHNAKVLTDRIHKYVQDNADQPAVKDKEGNVLREAEPPRTRLFCIAKGKNGGIFRWSDAPEALDK